MSLATRIEKAPKDFFFCRVFALDMRTGEEKYEELWCRSFYDVYAHLAQKGQRLIKYTMYA